MAIYILNQVIKVDFIEDEEALDQCLVFNYVTVRDIITSTDGK